MKHREAPSETRGQARRNFLKLGAGAGAMALINACAGTDEAAAPAPAGDQPVATTGSAAAAKDAETVIWEMPQSKRPPISIDVHSHWAPPSYTKAYAELRRRESNDRSLKDYLTNKIKWMDERAVQVVVLTMSGGMPWPFLAPAESARLAAMVNDGGIEAHKMFPDRFVLGAEIPATDPELSLKELNRIAGSPGVKGLHLPPSMQQIDYIFEAGVRHPFWRRPSRWDGRCCCTPLDGEIHEIGGTQSRIGQPLTEDTFIYNTLGFPMDTSIAGAMFIVTGTLDRFPNLQVVLPHAGGNFPYIAGRIEHGLKRRKFPLKRPFRDYIKQNFWFDTMAYYPETMRFMIEFAGVDRIMVGTDSSYDRSALDRSGTSRQGRYEWPNALVEYMKLPKDQEEMILAGNARKLFRLPATT